MATFEEMMQQGGRPVGAGPAAPRMGSGSSAGGSALRGFGQGLTAEFGDEAGAGLQAGLQELANLMPEGSLEWAGIDNRYQQDAGEVYRQAREENRAQLALDRDKHAIASGVGNAAGSVVLGAVTPGAGTYGQAAALGAAAGLGDNEADLTRPTVAGVGDAVSDTLKGAAFGIAGQYVGDAAGRAVPAIAKRLVKPVEDFAAMRALNAAGYAKAELKPIIKRGGVERAVEMGQTLLDEPGVIQAGKGIDSVLEGVEGARASWGEEMGALLQEADATGAVFDMGRVARRVIDEVIQPNLGDPAIEREVGAVAGLLRKYLTKAQQEGGLSFSEANKLKSTLQNGQINWGNHWNNYGPSHFLEKYQMALAGIFTDEIDNQIGRAAGPEVGEAFKAAKRKAGVFIDATAKAKNLNAAVQGNNGVSLKDLSVGAVAGGGVPGVLATAASKMGRERGAASLARGADNLATSLDQIARTNPEALGRYAGVVTSALARGPDALRAVEKVLNDTDPAWRAMRQKQQGSQQQPPQ